MGNKSNLRDLILRWKGENASEQQQEMDEKVLKALEPHSNLEILKIYGFKGRYFPPWTRMGNLTEICIENLPNCSRLPSLGDLPCLKLLKLGKLATLEYMMENEVEGGCQVKDAILCPSLEKLKLWSLPNLKGLLKHEEKVGEIFPKLQRLTCGQVGCPLLILPPLSSLKMLRCGSWSLNSLSKLGNLNYLSVIFDNDTRTCITKETLENLSNLKTLVLDNAKEHNLPIEEGLQGLKSLAELKIQHCDTLTCLPDVWLQNLTALEKLYINSCKELVELFPIEGMKYLHSSLKSLYLWDLPRLTSLPDRLDKFTSLQRLEIESCPKLTSLPASIQGMTNLRKLSIYVCPKLETRYEKEKGEDRHIIAHIPDVTIEYF